MSKGKGIGSSGLGLVSPKRPNSSPTLSSVQRNPAVMVCAQVKYICEWAGFLKSNRKTKDKKATQKTSSQGIYFLPAKLFCFVCSNYFCYCSLWNLVDRDVGWISTPTSKENAICLSTGPRLCVMKPSLEMASFQVFCPHSSVITNTNLAILRRACEKQEAETVTAGLLNPD